MEEAKRYAVVTGANKGIGFEICRQLASNGITVVLTARNEKRGLEAVQKLKESGLSNVIFHQLDVAEPATLQPLADFITNQFGKLDILVNNAGIDGVIWGDVHAMFAAFKVGIQGNWSGIVTQTPKLAETCIETNYYGAKRMCENVKNEWVKAVLDDADNLTEEKIDEVLKEYIKDFKNGSLEAKGWPTNMSAYILSKAAVNAYTRILAKKLPNIGINCVCPGYVQTDINFNTGVLTVEQGAENVVKLALLPNDSPGLFFNKQDRSPF